LKIYRADLHVHTVLSPCAGVEMIPPLIVQEALDRGIQMIAITDHNATANIGAVQKAAAGSDLVVFPGVELQTREEVHALCLFDQLEQAEKFQLWIDEHLPATLNNPDFFGEQFVVDETGDFIRREDRLLINSITAGLRQAWEQVTRLDGLLIPAHINRQAFGLIPVLGLVPDDFPVDALEISRHISPAEAIKRYPQIRGCPLIQNGDVHFLDDFLGATHFEIETPSIHEIRQAIHSENGRSYQMYASPSPG
jgi:3',5'-nucleoside bisphosphate phosphatase